MESAAQRKRERSPVAMMKFWPKLSRRKPQLPAYSFVFFALFYLYIWLVVRPDLIYHGFWITTTFPVFSTGWPFFEEFLVYPGGPVEWFAALLCQSYYYPWAGALVIAAVAALLSLTAHVLITALCDRRPRVLHFVPALLLLLLYNRYVNPLTSALALLAATACACLYVQMPFRKTGHRLALFGLLSVTVYYAAGGAYLLYAALCGLYELLRGWRRALGALCLLSAAVIPYVAGEFVFGLRLRDAYFRLLPFHPDSNPNQPIIVACLYAFFLVAAVGVVLWERFALGRRRAADGSASRPGVGHRKRLAAVFRSLVPFILAVVVLCASYDRDLKGLLRIEYYACNRMWPELLAEARRLPWRHHNLLVNWDVNRALYHTGGLASEMFSFPQHPLGLAPSPATFPELGMTYAGWMKLSDVLFELGRVNESERLTYEVLEFAGDRPRFFQRLSLISMAKGEKQAARILLGALSKDLVYRGWAEEFLHRLNDDALLSADPEIQRLQSVMVEEDVVGSQRLDWMLTQLLTRNTHNRMAFEYLMAYYLLNRDLEGIARNIGRLDDFDYVGVPRHYEEALLLYASGAGTRAILPGRSINPDTRGRLSEVARIIKLYANDPRAAANVLGAEHGASYFFYFAFGSPGDGR